MSIKVEIGMPTSHVSDTYSTYHRHTYALSELAFNYVRISTFMFQTTQVEQTSNDDCTINVYCIDVKII